MSRRRSGKLAAGVRSSRCTLAWKERESFRKTILTAVDAMPEKARPHYLSLEVDQVFPELKYAHPLYRGAFVAVWTRYHKRLLQRYSACEKGPSGKVAAQACRKCDAIVALLERNRTTPLTGT